MSLLEQMSSDLNIEHDFILGIAKKSKYYYKHFTIPKKNGDLRDIYHPSPILKTFQYWLMNNFFNRFPISDYAFAYRKGYSIKQNASQHSKNNYILHLDIKNFFESIKKEHLENLFRENRNVIKELNMNRKDIDLICNICLFGGKLTIGSVSSPMISNVVMYNVDQIIAKTISPELTYTRYADDLVFSSKKYIKIDLVKIIKNTLNENGFIVNSKKTCFMSKKKRRSVTGLIVDKGKITIGLQNKRLIKSMVYNKLKYGKGHSSQILGYLFFLKDIEPHYFNRIIIKYSTYGNVLELLKNDNFKKEAAPSRE